MGMRWVGRVVAAFVAMLASVTVGVGISAVPVSAASISASGSIGGSYTTPNGPNCVSGGATRPYAYAIFHQEGAAATTLTASVSAQGFTPVVYLHQGGFLPNQSDIGCFSFGTGSTSFSSNALCCGATLQVWTVVVAGSSASDTGTFTITFDSSNTAVSAQGVTTPTNPPDTTPPVLSLPSNQTVEASSASGATVSFSASANDAVSGSRPVSCSPVSGSVFPIATTTVSCSASDAAGNTANGSFTVTVVDTTAPQVTVPSNITAEATGPSGAVVTYSGASSTDAVSGSVTPVCSPASGSTFALGSTTVTCSATDTAGNTGSGSFTVTVVDTTAPQVTAPSDVTAEATGPSGAVVTYSGATSTDAVSGSVTPVCSPSSGSTFSLGTTTVSCAATDMAGNTGSASFSINVADTEGPLLGLPGDISETAIGPDGAAVTFTPTATDAVDGDRTVTCVPPSGSTFPLGSTTVNCSSTDSSGNTSTGSFVVTVLDEGDPLLVLPDDLVVEATGAAGATVPFDATATDDVDPDPSVVCTPASGDLFPLGSTDVSCTATDNDDNATAGTFNVTVADSTAPTLDLPDDITVEASAPTGASVEFDVTAADAVDPDPVVACTPPSGDEFAVGTTTVHCTATDAAGNTGSGEFSVTVTDSTGPTLDLPDDIEVTASGPDGAVVTYEATAQDSVGGDVPVDCQPPSGSLFPVGTTVVTCTATDNPVVPAGFYGYVRAISQIDPGPGNVTTGTFTVTVRSAAPTPDSPSTTTGGTPTTTPAGALPATGVPSTGVTLIAALILMAGAGLLGVAGLNRQRHER